MIAGRYTLEREVGRGGMGVVWLARDEVLGRNVAMKRVGMFPGGGDPNLERAAREARLAATLNHPHVVAVFDLVTDGDAQWLVMEYVDCVTLGGLVKRDGPLDPDLAAHLVGQAAQALAAAHAAGIVHRDVKPANLLVTGANQVKLTDFGIARAVADASLTQTGLVTGSPAYLAPEVAAGNKATNASDTWSLGATLFHALAGHPPYEVTENPLGTLYKIIHEDPPRLPDAGWLAPVLESTMATDPEDRWSMERVRDVLAMGPTATPQTTQYMATPSSYGADDAERTQALPPTSAPLQEDPPDNDDPAFGADAPAPAPEPRSRRRRVSPGLLALLAAVVVLALVVLLGWALLSGDPDQNQPAADKQASGSETPSQSPSPTEKKAQQKPEEKPEKKPEKPTRAEMSRFVEDYLATVTTSPAQSWKRLTPQFQAESGGFGSYQGFWSTIESASPSAIRANPRDMTVSYSVTYQNAGGGTQTENVTLELVEKNGEYLIAGEQ